MDAETPAYESVPMVKEEIIKEDGRYLIYYTFPPEDAPTREEKADAGEAHV